MLNFQISFINDPVTPETSNWCYHDPAGELTPIIGGTIQRLEPKVSAVLQYFLNHPGQVITRAELLHEVWGDTFVVEESLTRCISLMRRALGDRVTHRYVQTLPKRGYRFVAQVKAVPQCPCVSQPSTTPSLCFEF